MIILQSYWATGFPLLHNIHRKTRKNEVIGWDSFCSHGCWCFFKVMFPYSLLVLHFSLIFVAFLCLWQKWFCEQLCCAVLVLLARRQTAYTPMIVTIFKLLFVTTLSTVGVMWTCISNCLEHDFWLLPFLWYSEACYKTLIFAISISYWILFIFVSTYPRCTWQNQGNNSVSDTLRNWNLFVILCTLSADSWCLSKRLCVEFRMLLLLYCLAVKSDLYVREQWNYRQWSFIQCNIFFLNHSKKTEYKNRVKVFLFRVQIMLMFMLPTFTVALKRQKWFCFSSLQTLH